MNIHFWEFVRVIHELAHDDIQSTLPSPSSSFSSATNVMSPSLKPTVTTRGEPSIFEDLSDNDVLRLIATHINEKRLSTHTLIRKFTPECQDGKLDRAGLDHLFRKLGFQLSVDRLDRFMGKGDLSHNGKIASWELVRLLNSCDTSND